MRNFKLPSKKEITRVILSFTKVEWYVFIILFIVLLVSTIMILGRINKSFTVAVPMYGGSLSEGIIGTPRFINPILANTDADRDLVALIYSGLMRKGPDGNMIPDLAEKVDMSKDGTSYVFTLRENIFFHDNTPVTIEDVIFTIDSIKDPIIKSPRKGVWDGVSVEKIDDRNIRFTLSRPFASFLENTSLGIMPKNIWQDSPIELNVANTNPIGSGPYKIKKLSKQSSGIVNAYDLEAFKKFSLGKPYLKNISLKFYQNEENLLNALKTKSIDQASSITPASAESLEVKNTINSFTLPRIFGLFFNQSQNQIFTNKVVIKAINQAIDKENIINEVLSTYGVVINNPIPANLIAFQELNLVNKLARSEIITETKTMLEKDGWKIGPSGYLEKTITNENKKKVNTILEFSISTGNAPELAKTAELIKKDLNAVGMKVEVKTFEIGNLNQSVIRPRDYDALLFGEIINTENDLYAFWHSSQRKDPGLNVAMYTNAKVDKILEDAFITMDPEVRAKKYIQFEEEIQKDMPAVFLYSPNLIYITLKELKGLSIKDIVSPSDRFANVYLWYTKVDNIWKVFSK
ncbi:MAG: peptide ABC transporter substrate-binding protein [Candidatus Pacebacteria bacterium]|nr:peptide ABC transporter substrate-binding protein [Candidatus Paceibacterota bacterium]